MLETHKVTVHLPPKLLKLAMGESDKTVTEIIRDALKKLAHKRACEALLALEGKVKFQFTAAELRGDE